MAVLLSAAGWGCAAATTPSTLPSSPENGEQEPVTGSGGADGSDDVSQLSSLNEGGGDLALRLGGSTYTGQAVGGIAEGTLSLMFDDAGVLTRLGGAVVGDYLGLPAGSEVFFNFEAMQLEGAAGDVLQITVVLTGDSLSVRTLFQTTSGVGTTQQAMTVEGTLRFATDEDIQGVIRFPGFDESALPEVTLQRQG